MNIHVLTANIRPLDINGNLEEYKKLAESILDDGTIILPSLAFTGFNVLSMASYSFFAQENLKAVLKFAEHFKKKNNLFILGGLLNYQDKTLNVHYFINKGKILNVSVNQNALNQFDNFIGTEIIISKNNVKVLDNFNFNGQNFALAYAKRIEKNSIIIYPNDEKQLLNSGKLRIYNCELLSYEKESTVISIGSGFYDSSTSCLLNSDKIISKNGNLLKFSGTFDNENIISENCNITAEKTKPLYKNKTLTKDFFIPQNDRECAEIFNIITRGLSTRLKNTGIDCITLGMSGGSDSTLTLIAAVAAFKELNLDMKNLIAVTLPGFGTSSRTFDNSVALIKELKVGYFNFDIKKSVKLHLKELNHNKEDVVYENAQARERTQILMDLANKHSGMMIGTGDMSEIALGFSTFGGDHLSMYCVNGNIAKTTVLALLKYLSKISNNEIVKKCLFDVSETPISHELKRDVLSETIIGNYELNDYFLYKFITEKLSPKEIFEDAKKTLTHYTAEEILHWLKSFLKRFVLSQFKRNCACDSVQVFETCISYNCFKMVSDASFSVFLKELEDIKL